jgi:hypothetical protein
MTAYTIDRSSNWRRKTVEDWLYGLDLVSRAVRDDIVTAWVSSWASSPYERLEDVPFTAGVDYPLTRHVNEVTRGGVELGRVAAEAWGADIDHDTLMSILMLHDVDKPLMTIRTESGEIVYSELSREIPHGVVGAMLLKDLGFPHLVVSTVATHAGNSPFHGRGVEAQILHYADFFSADNALKSAGRQPFYQRHWA